jgi:glycosyltransferase involved in cell wall biosynthesis
MRKENISKKKLVMLVNVDWFFLSHRLPIALSALEKGYEVHIATGITDRHDELLSYGFMVHSLPIGRSNTNILGEIHTFIAILNILRRVQPNLLHSITSKPVLYGGIAAQLTGIKNVVAAISGLGLVFAAQGWKARIRRTIIAMIYCLSLRSKNLKVIFQNPNNRDTITRYAKLKPHQIAMIPGSGVDLTQYTATQLPSGTPIVLMAARLLQDKGVYEFIAAANILKQKGMDVRFQLAGKPDPENPHSITETEFQAWQTAGVVEMLGHRNDMSALLANAHIFVSPSFYAEGLSKTLIEAAASGRPVVTTDMPGCRDAIIPNATGLLIPPRDPSALANAIEKLLLNTQLCQTMGNAGRQLAEERYSIKQVVETHLNIYEELLNQPQ